MPAAPLLPHVADADVLAFDAREYRIVDRNYSTSGELQTRFSHSRGVRFQKETDTMPQHQPSSMESTRAKRYKEEVLGKRCWILFEVDGQKELSPFSGRVQAYKAELQADGITERKHLIAFDDGEEVWFDLEAENEGDRLWWGEDPPSIDEAYVLEQEAEDAKPAAAMTTGTPPRRPKKSTKYTKKRLRLFPL